MTNTTRPRRRRQRATAARQALRLCEAELPGSPGTQPRAPGASRADRAASAAITTRAALRAAGVPPHIAAALRSRLRLIPEQEAER